VYYNGGRVQFNGDSPWIHGSFNDATTRYAIPMTDFVVRCPDCSQGSRVPFEARGLTVECPRCGRHFPAWPEHAAKARNPSPEVPVVRPAAEAPPEPEPVHDHEQHTFTPHGLLIAVALLPLGVPLLWLTASLLTGRAPVFSFVAPVAMALGAGGLCAGIATVHIWGFAARIRAMLAVVVLAYAVAGVMYFTKPTWVEVARKLFQGFGVFGGSTEYRPQDRSFSVRFPGKPVPEGDNPIKGWRLGEIAVFSDPRRTGEEVFTAAHGMPPAENFPLVPLSDDLYFGKLREELLKATGGTMLKETPVPHGDATIREYQVQLPDGVSKRIVRVARTALAPKWYYLSVEGPFLAPDTPEVRDFFRSFKLLKR
jgi:hypothetical protein